MSQDLGPAIRSVVLSGSGQRPHSRPAGDRTGPAGGGAVVVGGSGGAAAGKEEQQAGSFRKAQRASRGSWEARALWTSCSNPPERAARRRTPPDPVEARLEAARRVQPRRWDTHPCDPCRGGRNRSPSIFGASACGTSQPPGVTLHESHPGKCASLTTGLRQSRRQTASVSRDAPGGPAGLGGASVSGSESPVFRPVQRHTRCTCGPTATMAAHEASSRPTFPVKRDILSLRAGPL